MPRIQPAIFKQIFTKINLFQLQSGRKMRVTKDNFNPSDVTIKATLLPPIANRPLTTRKFPTRNFHSGEKNQSWAEIKRHSLSKAYKIDRPKPIPARKDELSNNSAMPMRQTVAKDTAYSHRFENRQQRLDVRDPSTDDEKKQAIAIILGSFERHEIWGTQTSKIVQQIIIHLPEWPFEKAALVKELPTDDKNIFYLSLLTTLSDNEKNALIGSDFREKGDEANIRALHERCLALLQRQPSLQHFSNEESYIHKLKTILGHHLN